MFRSLLISATMAVLSLTASTAAADASCVCYSGATAGSVDPSLHRRLADEPEGLLWCEGPDDARCSPSRDGQGSNHQLVPTPPAAVTSTPDLPEPHATDAGFVVTASAPATGMRHRLERPPRA